MLYLGGGYPGLYFPPWARVFPPPTPPDLETTLVVEIPMLMVTGALTRQARVLRQTAFTMQVLPRLTIPMTRGLAEHATVPMRVTWRTWLDPSVVGAEIPMHLEMIGTARPARVLQQTAQPMVVAPRVTIPTTRGLAELVEIPMQIRTHAIMERD
jgi:hypothetical protein